MRQTPVGSAQTDDDVLSGLSADLFSSVIAPPSSISAAPSIVSAATNDAATSPYTTVTVQTGAVTFNLKFVTADLAFAPAYFMQGVETAASILSAAIKNTMTLSIVVNVIHEVGALSAENLIAYGGPNGVSLQYSIIESFFQRQSHAPPLPAETLIPGGTSFFVSFAQSKAMGFSFLHAGLDDGAAYIGSAVASQDILGAALNALTGAMGRVPGGTLSPTITELTRFLISSEGSANPQYDLSGQGVTNTYFSVDGGKTALADYSNLLNFSNFDNQGASAGDPFQDGPGYGGAAVQGLSALDLIDLAALGFNTLDTSPTPCFVTGTGIRTTRGDVAVEKLAVGDLVVTASGEARPVKWIGRRALDLRRHPGPEAVTPVRVAAGAFGAGLPYRDLLMSPDHSLAFEGALIPVSRLVNGRSVAPKPCSHVEYWHVELDAHDVILAEGLAAESYLDTGNRTGFVNGGAFVEAHPDFRPKFWAETCLPLACDGAPVVAAKRRLLEALDARGEGVSGENDAHLVVDGRRVDPVPAEGALVFCAPPDGKTLVLRSRRFVPAHSLPKSQDSRSLGLSVARLEIDGVACALDGFDGAGWHEPEYDARGAISHRWTNGEAQLPAGSRSIVVTLAGPGFYLGPAARSEPAAA